MLFVFTSLEAVCRSIFGKPVSSNLSSLIGLAGWLIAAMVYAFLVYYVRNQRLNLNKIKILAIAFTPIPPRKYPLA